MMFFVISSSCYSDSKKLCISPVKEKDGDKGIVLPPPGDPEFGKAKKFDYYVQINNAEKIKPASDSSTLFNNLSEENEHVVKIYLGTKLRESFKFSFSQFEEDELCLYFNNFYETWSLYSKEQGKSHCRCSVK